MNAGQLLQVFADLVSGLKNLGIMAADGTFTAPSKQQDAALAAMVESVLKAHGVGIPAKVDQIVQMVPLFLALVG